MCLLFLLLPQSTTKKQQQNTPNKIYQQHQHQHTIAFDENLSTQKKNLRRKKRRIFSAEKEEGMCVCVWGVIYNAYKERVVFYETMQSCPVYFIIDLFRQSLLLVVCCV